MPLCTPSPSGPLSCGQSPGNLQGAFLSSVPRTSGRSCPPVHPRASVRLCEAGVPPEEARGRLGEEAWASQETPSSPSFSQASVQWAWPGRPSALETVLSGSQDACSLSLSHSQEGAALLSQASAQALAAPQASRRHGNTEAETSRHIRLGVQL